MITVVMAVYNGEAYLRQQIDSILEQTVWETEPMKILASDDGSSDGSRFVIREYEEKYPGRVMGIYREAPSGGAWQHFMELISMAGKEGKPGDYLMLSDQDDRWFPDKAERSLRKMKELEKEHPGCPVLVHSDMRVVDENLSVMDGSYFHYQKISPERNRLSQLLVQNNVTGGAIMMNTELAGLLREKPSVCLMHDNWIALVASVFGIIGWVPAPLYDYRQHGKNSLGAKKGDTIEESVERLKNGSQAEKNYRAMYGQAEELLRIYGGQMDRDSRETLEAFLGMRHQGRLKKIGTMLARGFTKNSWFRTLGQMLFMP